MNIEFLAQVKERIERVAPPERKQSIDSFKWGAYDIAPGNRGVCYIDNGWYTYLVSDRAETVFTGPIGNEELFGYLCGAIFAIDTPEQALGFDRLFEIMNSKFMSLEEVHANTKKKLYEMKKDILEQKMGEGKNNTPKM